MTIKLDEDNITVSPTQIDDTDSPYLTNGEQYIYVDTTNGPVTIQLASSDTVDGAEIRIIDAGENASTNTITIQTEGSENINPGSNSSITLTVDGTYVDLFSDGSNWFSDRAVEKTSGQISGLQSLGTEDLTTLSFEFAEPTGVIDNEGAQAFIAPLGFGSNEGWTSYLQLDHNGTSDGAFYGFFRVLMENHTGATPVNESGTLITAGNDGDFGATGATESISTHLRFKVDDADPQVAYIQVDRDQQFIHGIIRSESVGEAGVSITALDPV